MLFCIKFTLAKLFFCARAKEPKPVRGFRFPRTPKRPRRGENCTITCYFYFFGFVSMIFRHSEPPLSHREFFAVGSLKSGPILRELIAPILRFSIPKNHRNPTACNRILSVGQKMTADHISIRQRGTVLICPKIGQIGTVPICPM